MNVEIRKLTDEEYKLSMQLFIGKVIYELGMEKTTQLLRESKLAMREVFDEIKKESK